MRITYLHQYFNSPNMSGSTRSYEMAKKLVEMGHEVNIVTSWREKGQFRGWFTTVESGITVHWLPVVYSNHMTYGERIRAFFHFAWEASRKAATIPSDIVFATSTPLTISIPGVYAARKQRVSMVFEVRDLWPELPIAVGAIRNPVLKFIARKLEKFAYKNSHEIVALSEGMRDGIVRVGYPRDRITVIPNVADLDRFHPCTELRKEFRRQYGIPNDAILIVYAGTFGKINGVGYLVKLAEALKSDRRFYFLTVGDGQEFESVYKLASETQCLGLNFSMLPKVPKAEMGSVFASADIAISTVIPLPELEANSANKFFDGLAAGCCMAVNHGGWQSDLLQSTGAGMQLSTLIDVASKQLVDWANAPGKIYQAGQISHRIAVEQFAKDKLATKLEAVLNRVYSQSIER